MYSFNEAWPSHLEFVASCAVHDRPMSMGEDEQFRVFVESLDPQYRPPSAGTICNRITMAINMGIEVKLRDLFERLRGECASQSFLGTQFDGWAAPNCKSMHLCITVTFLDLIWEKVMLKPEDVQKMSSKDAKEKLVLAQDVERAKLYMEEALLSYEEFPYSKHLGIHIATHFKNVIDRFGLTLGDIRMATPDGGSNMLCAVKILKVPSRYCYPHKLQRAILEGISQCRKTLFFYINFCFNENPIIIFLISLIINIRSYSLFFLTFLKLVLFFYPRAL